MNAYHIIIIIIIHVFSCQNGMAFFYVANLS